MKERMVGGGDKCARRAVVSLLVLLPVLLEQ